jgi:hypothetical protein
MVTLKKQTTFRNRNRAQLIYLYTSTSLLYSVHRVRVDIERCRADDGLLTSDTTSYPEDSTLSTLLQIGGMFEKEKPL